MNYVAVKKQLVECYPQPRSHRLVEIIEEHIRGKKLRPGQRLPSQRELMSKLAVSNSTVDRAIRELTSRGVIYSRQGLGTFVAERTESKPSNIAVLIPARAEMPYYDPQMLLSIEDEAHRGRYNVMFCNTANDIHKVDSYLEKLLRENLAGVVYVPVAVPSGYYEKNIERIRRLRNAGVEVVLCDRHFLNIPEAVAGFELDCVYSDDIRGTEGLIQHLIDNGRKKIALISPPMDSNVENRIVGYRKTLADNGIPYFSELVRFVESYDAEEIAGVVDKLLELGDRPDAIFAINDRTAEMVMNALVAKSVSIPQEIAVVGYDNYETRQYLGCPLTTVDRNTPEIGRVAMELLLERIAGLRTTPKHIALPTELIVRESCGSAPMERKNIQPRMKRAKKQKEAMPMQT